MLPVGRKRFDENALITATHQLHTRGVEIQGGRLSPTYNYQCSPDDVKSDFAAELFGGKLKQLRWK